MNVLTFAKDENTCSQASTPAERKHRLEQELSRYVRLLTERGTTEQVIVFGSMATGYVHAWSDIDLVIVEHTDLPFSKDSIAYADCSDHK